MNGTFNINITENNGFINVGDQQNVTILCRCGLDCHNVNSNTAIQQSSTSAVVQQSSTSDNAAIQPVLPSLRINDVDLDVLSDIQNQVNAKLCLCAVYEQEDKIVVESPLSKFVTNLTRDKNCPHFEVQLKVTSVCKICKGNNGIMKTYASQEFECTLIAPQRGFDEIKRLELRRVSYQQESETPFQAFLTQSQNIIKTEGNLIRIIAKVCENGKKLKIKLRFDVRSSVLRRVKSLSDFDSMKKQLPPKKFRRKSNSFGNIRQSCLAKSSVSLGKSQSAITINDVEVELQESEKSEVLATLPVQEERPESTEDQVDLVDGLDLNGLENEEPFAIGEFGSLYKVSRKGRNQLVKIVKTSTENENFLEEARQFRKCRHPYVRPTADILEQDQRSFVFYWFLDGQSLFKALEDNAIKDYTIFCRILYGIVKGLVYLRRIGLDCQYLTPEKVLLDNDFNPRISGVGLAYFKRSEHAENVGGFHRSLSYLDCSLRSSEENHSKNIVWSVGRCIWDMLIGRILERPGPEDILLKYNIIEHLEKSCDDQKIKTAYFTPELRKIVYGAGWPNDKEITKSLVVCAFKCMYLNLDDRMSLDELDSTLEAELCDLRKKVKFSLYKTSSLNTDLCLYCIENKRDKLQLTCGCATACTDCLRDNVQLDCPDHGLHYSKIGHPLTYGVILQGEFHEDQSICENDSATMARLIKDQNIFAIKNIERVEAKNQKDVCDKLKKIKTKIMNDEKAKDCEKYPRTLLLFIAGHSNAAGNLMLPDGSTLKKKALSEFISETNPKNLIVFANGHYSEKLVKNLSVLKTNLFYTSCSRKFFGVFSHGSNMCTMSDRGLCENNSILVKFVLDILEKDQSDANNGSEKVTQRYLTVAGLADEISSRMQKRYKKCLKPVDRDGGHIPIVYI